MRIAALPGGLGQQFRGGPRVVADDELHATGPALLETTDELLTAAGARRLASSTASTWRRPSSVLFELIAEREHKSLAITANTPFSQWGEVFVDPAMTLAAVDRLVHHSTILEMNRAAARPLLRETPADHLSQRNHSPASNPPA